MRWSYLWGATDSGYDYGQDVSVAGGMMCASGSFAGAFDFGGGLHTAGGYNDAFVLCLDAADGTYRWDRAFGTDLSDVTEGVKVAASGDVVISGSTEGGGADFGGGPIADAAGFFVARYGPDGAYQWAHTYPNSGTNFGASPGVDAAGNVYAVGRFHDVVDFGGGTRTPAEPASGFVLALDPDGGHRWDYTTGTYVTLYGATTQSNGNVVICGEFTGTLSLGGEAVPSHNEQSMDAFAVAFDANGAFQWQYTAGGSAGTRGFGIAIGPGDELVLAGAGGESWAEFELGPESHTNAGSDDGALVFLR